MTSTRSRCSATHEDVIVGGRVRSARELLGRSQNALASSIGVSYQQVQKYEAGTNRIPTTRLQDIARYLGISVTDLIGEGGDTGSSEIYQMLRTPGATSLLRDYFRITDTARRQILLTAAQTLAVSSTRMPTTFEE